ncbi:MAG TPA: ABC-F family ATP-binding cassette domain-containing protein [Bryobacteraceae bacterium]|jgi:ATP-binding cassette subfamily F protein uup|nr:ABC-F family ATP-binding cassette domain-containing protein [Bryobacteraceae bacterium]
MASLINVSGISKTFGIAPLFENISLNIGEGDRLGLIGPNGAGKSTLLEILTGRREPDTGNVALKKATRLAYVTQDSQFPEGLTVRQVVHAAMAEAKVPEEEKLAREAETLGRAGFEDFDQQASKLSGGWRKRLAIAEALVQSPDIVMLDEPTNHLDLAGIAWLEDLLNNASFACVVVSHDRYFLENVATAMVELNPAFPNGTFYVSGNYSAFLEKKGEFLHAQAKHQDALENRVKTEMEWLRRGPKARATKSKARIDKAQEMIGELKDLKIRTRVELTDIDFSATDRKTKRLVHLEGISHGFGDSVLFDGTSFTITAGMRAGLVGANGSGKTTLLRLLKGEMPPMRGEIQRADNLRIVSFDQIREIDQNLTLRRALAPDSDSVIYRERVIHVASWAAKFLFTSEQLNQPVRRLSGGERARVLIAKLMLEPADLLLLDEPTNDLDIPTLEILEESLLEFQGAMVLVTHDRYLLDRVATVVLGLDGKGGAERFADYSQWNLWQVEKKKGRSGTGPTEASAPRAAAVKKKLSYLEARDYETIEHRVTEAEVALEAQHDAVQHAASVGGKELEAAMAELEKRQLAVDELYERWAELEKKLG